MSIRTRIKVVKGYDFLRSTSGLEKQIFSFINCETLGDQRREEIETKYLHHTQPAKTRHPEHVEAGEQSQAKEGQRYQLDYAGKKRHQQGGRDEYDEPR